jgi:hypothetical protein
MVQSGVPVSVQIAALDAYGNLVRGYTGTATITAANATLSSSTVSFVNGVATIQATFATPGTQSITVKDSSGVVPTAIATTDVVASLNPGPNPSPTPTPTPTPAPTSSQAAISTNWSGYAAETSLRSPQSVSVTAVSGTWTVPAVTGSGTAYSAVWVGIDGYQSSSVEQIGTESDIVNGQPEYSVWYEMYPLGSVAITGMTVAPGDSITASVVYVNSGFQLTITDNTQSTAQSKDSFTIFQTAPRAQRSSAEWIVEAPSSNYGVLPLANFSSVAFSAATATIDGVTGPIDSSSWQSTAINMVTSRGALTAATSALADAGAASGFTVSYQSSGGSSSSAFPGWGSSGSGWRGPNALAQYASNTNSGGSPLVSDNPHVARDRLFASLDFFGS